MENKKALIVTLIADNLGNRLQNYALQQILKQRFKKVHTVINHGTTTGPKTRLFWKFSPNTQIIALSMLALLYKHRNVSMYRYYKRLQRYAEFDKAINFKKETKKFDNYDYLFAGSDQIWNFAYNPDPDFVFFASSTNTNKIAYAASIGALKCDDDKAVFAEYLPKFKAISVREDSAKEILTDIVTQPIDVILDPTLMLSPSDWDRLARKPLWMSEEKKYILLYTLGTPPQAQIILDSLNTDGKFIVINPLDQNSDSFMSGPSEFLWLIKNAEFVVTDSYHSTVFSILYHKRFVILSSCSRKNMFSRFETLCDKLGIALNDFTDCTTLPSPDFAKIDERLAKERKLATDFLDKATQ